MFARPAGAFVAVGAALVFGAQAASAQSRLAISVSHPVTASAPAEGPTIQLANVFVDARSAELLASGFPASVTITAELWASRTLFDDLLRTATVRRVVRYHALSRTYRIGRIVAGDSVIEEARLGTLQAVQAHLTAPFAVPLEPPPDRRGLYYTANVTIETLNSDDLAELQRWLQGEVQPAFRGEKSVGSPITRGLRTIFSRLLGGDVKRAEGRSETFESGTSGTSGGSGGSGGSSTSAIPVAAGGGR